MGEAERASAADPLPARQERQGAIHLGRHARFVRHDQLERLIVRVWIDQDLCTGDGICTEIAPAVFEMDDDGLAYVKEPGWPNRLGPTGVGDGPKLRMAEGTAAVPDGLLDAAIEAAEECPGECIFFEAD